MKNRFAFTMIELVFVIIVMGIIGKFGVEFLAQAYKSFIFSSVNNSLQAKSASAVEFIASRLQYRIKDSLIARQGTGGVATGIGSANNINFTVLEWIATDIDGYRGTTTPTWSGIADLMAGSNALINSPGTNTATVDTLISTLSYGAKGIDDAALYFIGSNSDITNGYGYNGPITTQSFAMHPIMDTAITTNFIPRVGNTVATANIFLTGIDVYEYYKLAWTAYAVVYTPGANNMGTLTLYYDYQPWNGDTLANARQSLIMEDVSTFQFTAIGSIIKIQVCTKTDLTKSEDEYSVCKEKTIF